MLAPPFVYEPLTRFVGARRVKAVRGASAAAPTPASPSETAAIVKPNAMSLPAVAGSVLDYVRS